MTMKLAGRGVSAYSLGLVLAILVVVPTECFCFPSSASIIRCSLASTAAVTSRIGLSTVILRNGGTSDEAVTTTAEDVIVGPELPPISPTSKRLFLVRHGEVINPGGPDRPVYYGAMDVPLSSLGEEEAKAAGQYLQQFDDLEVVASSPLSRAIYGATQVLAKWNQARNINGDKGSSIPTIFAGFKELDRGSWCGKTAEEIGLENLQRFDACDETITPDGGGESYPALKKRVLNARDEVLESVSPGNAAAIVSHLQVTRSMLSDALGIPINEMAQLKIATASITCIDYDIATNEKTVHFQSFKPDIGLAKSKDMAN